MKALIRREGETVSESMQIEGIDWNTGFPLTQKDWPGGAYTLVDNYEPQGELLEYYMGDRQETEELIEQATETVSEDDKIIEINGKSYKKSELKYLIDSL